MRRIIAEEAGLPERKIRLAQEIESLPQKVEKQIEAGKITAPQAKKIITAATEIGELVRDGVVELVDAKKLIAQPAALSFIKKLIAKAKAAGVPVPSVDVRAAVRQAKKTDYNGRIAAAKPKALEGKYRILYVDPPWKYVGLNQADEYGHAERYYDCLSDEQLIAYKPDGKRGVKEMADNNSVLFMWVTSPLLERCFPIIRAWGFSYKSSFVWDKIKHNMGHYNSVRHEFLLIATKGSCTPDVKKLYDSVVSIKRTEHSRKPKQFRDMIEKMYDHGRKLQLFSRKAAPGWDMVGNEI
jgi:N6-adenosine-specific RNA methylase IME4